MKKSPKNLFVFFQSAAHIGSFSQNYETYNVSETFLVTYEFFVSIFIRYTRTLNLSDFRIWISPFLHYFSDIKLVVFNFKENTPTPPTHGPVEP